jgi:uncharacterized protein DUF1579
MTGFYPKVATVAVAIGLAISARSEAQSQKAPADPAVAAALENAMTPGAGQQKLGFLVGTFDAKIRTWVRASDPPTEDNGVMIGTWVLDGRYAQMMLAGNVAGEPYSGIGYAGYNNTTKQYMTTFMDSAGTGMEWYTGGFDASGKRATLKGTVANAVTGKSSPVEIRLTLDDAGNHVMELWGEGLGTTMYKMMEISYTRRP